MKRGRKYIGIELKPEYFGVACKNLTEAENNKQQGTLFDSLPDFV